RRSSASIKAIPRPTCRSCAPRATARHANGAGGGAGVRRHAAARGDCCIIADCFAHHEEITMKRILLSLILLFVSAIALAAVNINTATKEELDALPGIGPVKAQASIDYRKQNGPFKTPEDIMKVKGIKEGEFGKIRNDITVSGANTGMPGAAPAKSATTTESRAEKSATSSKSDTST